MSDHRRFWCDGKLHLSTTRFVRKKSWLHYLYWFLYYLYRGIEMNLEFLYDGHKGGLSI